MKRAIQNVLAVAAFAVASIVSPAASAVPYFIDFYEADLSAGLRNSDLDGDGIVDGSGIFEGASPASNARITSFNATVAGSTWDSLAPDSIWPHAPTLQDFFGVTLLFGFVFEDPADYAFTGPVTVLQLYGYGESDLNGTDITVSGVWGLSNCNANICGGGANRGTYVITAGTPVPAPATLPLALLGIAALVAMRRRAA